MKNTIFKGMATAMVTPMTPHGVDYDAFARFIDFQLENGINALVAVGTTGESATLSPAERREVIRFTVRVTPYLRWDKAYIRGIVTAYTINKKHSATDNRCGMLIG